jgi:hypothetical protein
MSKVLSDLLDQPEHILTSFVGTLERLSGQVGEDIRLINEVSRQIMAKNLSLGLDPSDTNSQELYHALQAKFAVDCSNFEKTVNRCKKTSIDKKLSRVAKLTSHAGARREVWALKQPVAKELLRVHPPKALMRQLHYRSVDSMLKHEDIAGLYAAIPLTTSTSWQRGFSKTQSKLSPLDFET